MLDEGALRDLAALLSFSGESGEKRTERTSPQLDFAMSKRGGKGEAMYAFPLKHVGSSLQRRWANAFRRVHAHVRYVLQVSCGTKCRAKTAARGAAFCGRTRRGALALFHGTRNCLQIQN